MAEVMAALRDIPSSMRDLVEKRVTSLRPLNTNTPTLAAKDFTLMEAIHAFGLTYTSLPHDRERLQKWNVQDIPETKEFKPTQCLNHLITTYAENFERTSEAMCRTALDFMLNECLTVMKGNHIGSEASGSRPQATPTPSDSIKIFGEVSFTHRITAPRNGISNKPFLGVTVNGRIDHGVGRAIHVTVTRGRCGSQQRRFQSLLLILEAKSQLNLDEAVPQLVVYLGSLHQSRLQRNRSDATVYGVASNGYVFIFVSITHEGELKISKRFDTDDDSDIVTVLGCLKFLLETSRMMSPNVSPENGGGEENDGGEDGDFDPGLEINNNELSA